MKQAFETVNSPKVLGVDIDLPENMQHLSGWIHIGYTAEGTPLLLEPPESFSRIVSHYDYTTTSSARVSEVGPHIEKLKSDGHSNARLPTEAEAHSIFSTMPAMPSDNDFMTKTGLRWAGYWVEPGKEALEAMQKFSQAAGYSDGHLVDQGLAEFSMSRGEVQRPLPLSQERDGMLRAVQEAPVEIAKRLIPTP